MTETDLEKENEKQGIKDDEHWKIWNSIIKIFFFMEGIDNN